MTPEQKQIRTGKFCASQIWKLMGKKGLGQTGLTYIHEVAAEYLTGQPAQPEFSSAATSWGKDHEAEAQQYYEVATGHKTRKGETISNDHIVGTPDLLTDEFGIEIKCPYNSGNHLKNLQLVTVDDLKEEHPEYYWQIISYMWLTGLKAWKFCSYDPRFTMPEKRMLILNIKQDNDAQVQLMQRLIEAKEIRMKLII